MRSISRDTQGSREQTQGHIQVRAQLTCRYDKSGGRDAHGQANVLLSSMAKWHHELTGFGQLSEKVIQWEGGGAHL